MYNAGFNIGKYPSMQLPKYSRQFCASEMIISVDKWWVEILPAHSIWHWQHGYAQPTMSNHSQPNKTLSLHTQQYRNGSY